MSVMAGTGRDDVGPAVPPRRLPGAVPAGPVGRWLAHRLLAAGEAVRVLALGQDASRWPDGVEPIEGSVLRPAESPDAFAGLDRMFLAGAAPETRREAPTAVRDVVRRAVDGGVQDVAVRSSHGPMFVVSQPPEQWFWLAAERAVDAPCPRWTHIRPSAVMASMLAEGYRSAGSSWAETIRRGGLSGSRTLTPPTPSSTRTIWQPSPRQCCPAARTRDRWPRPSDHPSVPRSASPSSARPSANPSGSRS